ncbi:MAG TPA: M3 family metallopeptidase [Gammaproteobacteria bacterium]|jgi:oligopeptidase A|nr:M3 family metallopeptidase [Gammaproteobacteria bacterium]
MSTSFFAGGPLPQFSAIQPATIPANVGQLLEENKIKLAQLLAQPVYTWDNLMFPLEEMGDALGKTWSPISHLRAVMESDALRQAYHDTLPLLIAYHTAVAQNEQLFQAMMALMTSPAFASYNPAQKKILENEIRDFKLAGVHLSAEKKNRMAALQTQLSQLTTKFSENVLDATHAWTLHITDANQLAGLPAQAMQLTLENAKQHGLEGYLLTLDYPTYAAGIKFLHDRELRKTLYTAYCTRASDQGPNAGKWDNSAVMADILRLRHEMAQLVGFNNFAEYSLATKMAHSPEQVLDFLNDLLIKTKPIAAAEQAALVEFAQADGIQDFAAWDVAYYSEKLQETQFKFSQEDVRPYFPVDKVLNGLFEIVNKLYGLTIQEEKNIDVWHPQVRFFSLLDESGQIRGGFYVDLYARPHKRDGAWMDDCRARRLTQAGVLQCPVAFLTCNFMPPVEGQPALLTHDDVLTVFHEFGHCLHHLLTKVDYPAVGGISGVPWDAVEFPSQFLENYCWEKASLDLLAAHYQTGAPLPGELYEKMWAAKNFQAGLQMIRQLEFSLFDFRLHLDYDPQKKAQIQSLLNEIRQQTSVLPMPDFNRFQHSFSHIFAGGYAAGYYSYKWAEVLSADAYAKFLEKGIFDQATGRSFMRNILETGGVRDPMVSFVAFRGREPTIDALLQQSGIV